MIDCTGSFMTRITVSSLYTPPEYALTVTSPKPSAYRQSPIICAPFAVADTIWNFISLSVALLGYISAVSLSPCVTLKLFAFVISTRSVLTFVTTTFFCANILALSSDTAVTVNTRPIGASSFTVNTPSCVMSAYDELTR